jgi:hypothetical protein
MRALRLIAIILFTAAGLAACTKEPEPPVENADAYAACQQIMRDSYERWRQIHLDDMDPAEFGRRIHFPDVATDSATVKALGDGVFEVSAVAGRPSADNPGELFHGSFRCTVRQTWTVEGPVIQIG